MKISFIRKCMAVLAFWALAIFGGAIVMLWNAIAPSISQYRPGDLGYIILQTISTAVGAILAMWAADSIMRGNGKVLCMVNCIIAATFYAGLAGVNTLLGGMPVKEFISMGLAAIISIYCARMYSKEAYSALYKDVEREDIRKKYVEAAPIINLVEELAKSQGMTVSQYVRMVRMESKKAQGMNDAEAANAIKREDTLSTSDLV